MAIIINSSDGSNLQFSNKNEVKFDNIEKTETNVNNNDNIVKDETKEVNTNNNENVNNENVNNDNDLSYLDEQIDTDIKEEQKEYKEEIRKFNQEKKELEEKISRLEKSLNKEVDNKVDTKTELKKPVYSDYETNDEYLEALADYKTEIKIKELEEKRIKAEEEQKALKVQNEILKQWNDKIEAAQKKYKDWDDIKNSNIPINMYFGQQMKEYENGADILYYLYKNQDFAKELFNMSLPKQLVQLEKISEKINNKINNKKVTSAPEPIKTVKSNKASASVEKDINQMSFKEYKAFRKNK